MQDLPYSLMAELKRFAGKELPPVDDWHPVTEKDIDQIVECFEDAGATCKVSSIHVNGWFGNFDKLSGFKQFKVGPFMSTQ